MALWKRKSTQTRSKALRTDGTKAHNEQLPSKFDMIFVRWRRTPKAVGR
jgi:hypothetical protein